MNLETIENRTTREKSATNGNIIEESSNTHDILKIDGSTGLLRIIEFNLKSTTDHNFLQQSLIE